MKKTIAMILVLAGCMTLVIRKIRGVITLSLITC